MSQPTNSEDQLWCGYPEDEAVAVVLAMESGLATTPKNSQNSTGSTSTTNTLVGEVPPPSRKRKREASPSRPVQRLRLAGSMLPIIIPAQLLVSWEGFLRNCRWGVLWEVARLGLAGFDLSLPVDVESIKKLKGTNADVAPYIRSILRDQPLESKGTSSSRLKAENDAKTPWPFLDQEDKLIDGTGGMGCASDDPASQLADEPYGGLVEFSARLQSVGEEPKIVLLPPQQCPSTRFSRRFGSKRFFRLRIPRNLPGLKDSNLTETVRRPVVIMNQVFRAFTAKDSSVFFVQTFEEVYKGCVQPRRGKRQITDPMPFLEFLHWHNPLETNIDQTMAKWASRFLLGLSNSVPGIKIKPENLFFIRDINSDAFSGEGKVPSDQVMTDGCGFANRAMMRALRNRISWDHLPTAIQCRIAGAKGLLLLHPDVDENELSEPRVWIRDSQKKITHAQEPNPDPAMLIVDVLRASHMNSPARLSPETIINLAENGVPREIFLELFKVSLNEALDELVAWALSENADNDGSSTIASRLALWSSVARAGAVITSRIARMNSSSARAKGLVYEIYADDDNDDEEDATDEAGKSTAWWPDPVSGQPSSLEETILCLIDSGFDPRLLWILREKLRGVITRVADNHAKRCKIVVPESCSAFVVPDPYGVLEEGEIQVKCSHNLRFSDGWERPIVLGDVLVTRHPCKLPTDFQKVKAVERPELRDYTDVIVFSTKGKRSLASLLAGGDYDGDKVEVFWHPGMVSTFKPAPQHYADEPEGLGACFSQRNESVDSFLTRTPPSMSDAEKIYEIQHFLLSNVRNDGKYVGIYNDFYLRSMYMNGYGHRETKRLAYIFTTILDGAKTGKTIDPETFRKDKIAYGGRKPQWNESESEQSSAEERNQTHPRRPAILRTFIMDWIQTQVQVMVKEKFKDAVALLERQNIPDTVLLAPHDDVLERIKETRQDVDPFVVEHGERLSRAVDSLVKQVDEIHERWRLDKGPGFTALPIEERQDRLRKRSQEFSSTPEGVCFTVLSPEEARRIKTSYAYKAYNSRFPWDMAFATLCELKALSTAGSLKPVSYEFYYHFKLHQISKRHR